MNISNVMRMIPILLPLEQKT